MIKVIIYGLDNFAAADLSKNLNSPLANICEVEEDDIDIITIESSYLHNGIEQNGFKGFVQVFAPQKLQIIEHEVAHVLEEYLKTYLIQFEIVFVFYHEHDRFTHINRDYPSNINESNQVELTEPDNFDLDEVYTGDIFKNFNGKGED